VPYGALLPSGALVYVNTPRGRSNGKIVIGG